MNVAIVLLMLAPIRFLRGQWPAAFESAAGRFFWRDPRIVIDEDVSAEDFRVAMSAILVGGTYKITRANRHPLCDDLLIDHVDLTDADIVDIGASDGSTSVDLIAKLPTFRSYTMADLYFHMTVRKTPRHTLFYDPDGTCILVVGRRTLAWPSQSKRVEFLLRPIIHGRAAKKAAVSEVLLLNPDTRALMQSDERVSFRVHDVFKRWEGPAPSVIKIANLLRRLYFSDDDITRALVAVGDSLDDGGYLLMADNSRIKDMPARGGLYRKRGDSFIPVARTENIPEIDDLITQVRLSESLAPSASDQDFLLEEAAL